jgi:hypothetical protein
VRLQTLNGKCGGGVDTLRAPDAEHRPRRSVFDAAANGIDDQEEHRLLERYRPYFMLSNDGGYEGLRPADPWWYLQRSELLPNGDESGAPVIPIETLTITQTRF